MGFSSSALRDLLLVRQIFKDQKSIAGRVGDDLFLLQCIQHGNDLTLREACRIQWQCNVVQIERHFRSCLEGMQTL